MIRPAENRDIGGYVGDDPFLTRIRSLYQCYGTGFDFVGFWAQENDGETVSLISHFEDKFNLYLTDGSDLDEIAAFLQYIGAGSALFNAAYPLECPDAKGVIAGEVLAYAGKDYISDIEIYEPDFKDLYGLLQTCESEIFRVPDYFVFLSDVSFRRNRQKLTVAATTVEGVLASSVMTVSETENAVILGAVATHPDYRRRGLSREIVRTVATRLRGQGRRVYVLSASDSNTRFYKNSGFGIVAGFKEFFF